MGTLSDNHKFIFIHIPKTGGTSTNSVLREHGRRFQTIEGLHHYILTQKPDWSVRLRNIEHTAAPVLKEFLGTETWQEFHTFSIVRNPWARMVSLYSFIQGLKQHPHHIISHTLSFEEYVEYLIQTRHVSQWEFLSDKNGNLIVDTVLKTEMLSDEGASFMSKLLNKDIIIPTKNTSDHKPYTDIYTPRSKDIVAHAFRNDIEKFEYEF